MTLSAVGLPEGATFAAQKGLVTGSVMVPGTYAVTLRAENAAGTAERVLKLVRELLAIDAAGPSCFNQRGDAVLIDIGGSRELRGAQQREGADDVAVAATGLVFEEDGILLPVVADFDAGPVAADIGQPLGGSDLVVGTVADEVAGEGGLLARLFVGVAAGDFHEGTGAREVALQGLDRDEFQIELDTAAGGGFLRLQGKRGVAAALRAASARSLGRLLRTWLR